MLLFQVRMWNIPDQRVVDWADVHEMVTAVNFSPDGAKAIVGTMKGKCRFYRCANFKLEYEAQIGRFMEDQQGPTATSSYLRYWPAAGKHSR